MCLCVYAVSYTHLASNAVSVLVLDLILNVPAVSYTHLDVYKRQAYEYA